MVFSSVAQERPKQACERRAMRDEASVARPIQHQGVAQRFAATRAIAQLARESVYDLSTSPAQPDGSSRRVETTSYRSAGLTDGVTRNGTSRTTTVTKRVA